VNDSQSSTSCLTVVGGYFWLAAVSVSSQSSRCVYIVTIVTLWLRQYLFLHATFSAVPLLVGDIKSIWPVKTCSDRTERFLFGAWSNSWKEVWLSEHCVCICSTAMVEIWPTTCKVRSLWYLCDATLKFITHYDVQLLEITYTVTCMQVIINHLINW